MKIKTTIKHYVPYIPPRCRKPRYNEVTEIVTHNLREVSLDKVELAFTINFSKKYNVYLYKKKLYKPKFFMPNMWSNEQLSNSLEELVWVHQHCSSYYAKITDYVAYYNIKEDDYSCYETKDQIIDRIKADLGRHLVIDGVLYEEIYYPYYQICSFGLGGNHGGTALMPSFAKKPKKIIKNNNKCYSPYDFDNALKMAIKVATNRRDTEDVKRGFLQSITCHIPRLANRY